MIKRPVLLSWAAAVIFLTPALSSAQVSLSAGCSPGISDCGSLRFTLNSPAMPTGISSLFIQMRSSAWTFRAGPDGTTGTYSAEDAFGPVGGFTLINPAAAVFINFLDNGFSLAADPSAFIDLEANGLSSGREIWYSYNGVTEDGGTFSGTVTPEPISMVLLGSGLAGIAAARRRRKMGAPQSDIV